MQSLNQGLLMVENILSAEDQHVCSIHILKKFTQLFFFGSVGCNDAT